jgi:hypothetical protein
MQCFTVSEAFSTVVVVRQARVGVGGCEIKASHQSHGDGGVFEPNRERSTAPFRRPTSHRTPPSCPQQKPRGPLDSTATGISLSQPFGFSLLSLCQVSIVLEPSLENALHHLLGKGRDETPSTKTSSLGITTTASRGRRGVPLLLLVAMPRTHVWWPMLALPRYARGERGGDGDLQVGRRCESERATGT